MSSTRIRRAEGTRGIGVRCILALLALTCALASLAGGQPAGDAEAVLQWNDIDISQIPIEYHRRAVQLLGEMSGSELAPDWEGSPAIGQIVRPLYRPDVDGVAYYEFGVEGGGFIILSTGEHDYPIPHWDFTGQRLTDQLLGEARQSGMEVPAAYSFHKLDTLSYVLVSSEDEILAGGDDLPPLITGMDPRWLHERAQATEVEADGEGKRLISGEPGSPVDLGEWASWKELKEGYTLSYEVLLEALRVEASEDWDIERAAAEVGEGLIPGDIHRVPFLFAGLGVERKWTADGEGLDYVEIAEIHHRNSYPSLEIMVHKARPRAAPFEVHIEYYLGGELREEVLRFVVLDPTTVKGEPDDIAMVRPDQVLGPRLGVGLLNPGSWSQWHYFWAGSHIDQRLYGQFSQSGCISGCGAVAWAMLYGWIDHRACQGDANWIPRKWIYRVNAGKHPTPDACAPRNQDAGVRTMIWEIRNRLGSWCSSGATVPWDMVDGIYFLAGRSYGSVNTYYNPVGFALSGCRTRARDHIIYKDTPAIIGTGFLSHYPLAYGYAWRSRKVGWWIFSYTQYSRWFYVNKGWYGSGNGWVSASTWFAGRFY